MMDITSFKNPNQTTIDYINSGLALFEILKFCCVANVRFLKCHQHVIQQKTHMGAHVPTIRKRGGGRMIQHQLCQPFFQSKQNRTEHGSLAKNQLRPILRTTILSLKHHLTRTTSVPILYFKTSSDYKFFITNHVKSNSMQIQQQQPSKQHANENIKSIQLPLLCHLSCIYANDTIC